MGIQFNYRGEVYQLKQYVYPNRQISKSYYRLSKLNGNTTQKSKCKEILDYFGYWEENYELLQPYEIGYILYKKIIENHIPYTVIDE